MMRIAYLDCFAGISGDMFLGALLGAGVPLPVLEDAVAALGLDASLRVETVDRSGISSVKVHVLENGESAEKPHKHDHEHKHEHPHKQEHSHEHGPEHTHAHHDKHAHEHDHKHEPDHKRDHGHEHPHPHEHKHEHPHGHGRSLSVIRELIQTSTLAEPIKRRAVQTFELLGRSEAKIHNVPVEQIHFHEVGAVDAIVDIVASCAGIEHLGPTRWYASPVNVGGGMVDCAHGRFPVPAPATADLLRGMPTYSAHIEKELVTPTGAALLRMLGPEWGPQPPMLVDAIGYGAGSRNPKGFPNVLRLSVGESSSALKKNESEEVAVLETALDDASPQVLAYTAEQALAAGALDVMLAPVVMKKGRPGTLVTVLCNPLDAEKLQGLLLRETGTLGVRMRREQRVCLDREHVVVETEYGSVRVKLGLQNAEHLHAAPEYEDCRAAAGRHNVALKQVMQAALAAFARAKASADPELAGAHPTH